MNCMVCELYLNKAVFKNKAIFNTRDNKVAQERRCNHSRLHVSVWTIFWAINTDTSLSKKLGCILEQEVGCYIWISFSIKTY